MQTWEKVHGDAFNRALQCIWLFNVRVAKINKSHGLFHIDSGFVLKGKTINVQALLSYFPDVPEFTKQLFSKTVFKVIINVRLCFYFWRWSTYQESNKI